MTKMDSTLLLSLVRIEPVLAALLICLNPKPRVCPVHNEPRPPPKKKVRSRQICNPTTLDGAAELWQHLPSRKAPEEDEEVAVPLQVVNNGRC